MTVRELEERMDSEEFTYWAAYYLLEMEAAQAAGSTAAVPALSPDQAITAMDRAFGTTT